MTIEYRGIMNHSDARRMRIFSPLDLFHLHLAPSRVVLLSESTSCILKNFSNIENFVYCLEKGLLSLNTVVFVLLVRESKSLCRSRGYDLKAYDYILKFNYGA